MQTITAHSTTTKIKTARPSPLKNIGIALIVLAIAFGFITRILAVFRYVTFDIGPDPDQIRDAFIVMRMWQGDLPSLGPVAFGAGIGGFHIFPLYYYLFFPFTLLGNAPTVQAFPNALFSFLSIPLFSYLIYQLLENIHPPKRLFLSGFSGLWYSFLFGDIFISNFQWNPSSVPFFFMVFTLVYDIQMKNLSAWKTQLLAWTSSGLILSVLMSLHASALFIMPIVYGIISFRFIFKVLKKKGVSWQLWLPGLGILAAMVALTPYWASGTKRYLDNTRAILKTISSASGGGDNTFFLVSIFKQVGNAALHALNIFRQVYFWNTSLTYVIISIVVIVLITGVAFSKFYGNPNIWLIWLSTWGLLLLAVASFDASETVFYYKNLVLIAPIVLTVVALAYIERLEERSGEQLRERLGERLGEQSGKQAITYHLAIAVFIILSCTNNLSLDAEFMAAKYGPNRLMNTRDMVEVMAQLPQGAKICDPRIARKRADNNQYNYIDTYITQRGIETISDCQKGTFVIHPKRILNISGNFLNTGDYQQTYSLRMEFSPSLELWPMLTTAKNQPMTRSATLVRETQTAYIYLLS